MEMAGPVSKAGKTNHRTVMICFITARKTC